MKRITSAAAIAMLALTLLAPQAQAADQKKKSGAHNGQKKAAKQEAKAAKQAKAAAGAPTDKPKAPATNLKAPAAPETKAAGTDKDSKAKDSLSPSMDPQLSNEPTKIEAKSLTLFTKDKKFIYEGDVKVVQGDMTLTSKTLEGTYDDNNKIQTITALKDVVVIKGDKMKATGQRADYDAKSNTVVMKENPKLEQDGSELTADIIRVFLKDDRSTAEGNVRVTLVNKDGKGADLKGMVK